VGDEARRQSAGRQLAGTAREVDVLRELPLRADGVIRILPGRGRLRQVAGEDVAQVDGLHVIAAQIDVEVEDRDRQVGPDHDVREHGGRRGVVDGEQSGDPVCTEIDLEIRQQQSCRRNVINGQ
jgi:hypothetical protein